MRSTSDRIVVRRKRKSNGRGRHGGAWKIAYADYVTAMMAFFLVMWLLSLIPRDDLVGVAEYFRMPLMTAVMGGEKIDTSSKVVPGGSPSPIPNTNPITQRRSPVRGGGERRDRQRLEDLKSELESLIRTKPVLSEFRPQLLLDMTPEGLRVQIVDNQNRPMFATGSAYVLPYMRDILRELGPTFNDLPNRLTITGHTDAMQYASGERHYSNWELSADRANAARRELVAGGMSESKIKQVLGLSSTVSLIKDDPAADVNRRISILVLNQHTERLIDEQNALGQFQGQIDPRALVPSTEPAQDDEDDIDEEDELADGEAAPGQEGTP